MKAFLSVYVFCAFQITACLFLISCSKEEDKKQNGNVWDIETQGIPKFVSKNYLDLDKIYRISKFRSSVGHDYSDGFEQCRSMKHYFEPKANLDWTTIDIYSPVGGEITRVEQEWAGTKIELESEEYPAFRFSIFHILTDTIKQVGEKVAIGEHLGKHIGNQTYSDISVIVNDPTHQGRFVSFFDVITDDVFQQFRQKGASDRTDFIISKAVRDAHPLVCNGDQIVSLDSIESWFELK